MSLPDLTVRPIRPDERAAWEPLWRGYLAFYKASQAPAATDVTWARIHDPAEPMGALGAERGGRLIGIVHYLFHRSFWTTSDYCYLQDLYVDPSLRGRGIGRALIARVYERASALGCSRVWWLTHETNTDAMKLYDQVADRSGFVQYRKLFKPR